MKNKISNTSKLILLSVFINVFCFNICIANYNEVNLSESELSTSTIEQIEYKFPEKNSGQLQNELNQIDDEQGGTLMNLINFKKPYFWLLIIALGLILAILIRLFKKLSHMNQEFENYKKKIINSKKEVKDADEIVYSINETNEIKPAAENIGEIKEIKINQSFENLEEDMKNNQIKTQSENLENKEEVKKDKNEDDDDYIFEE